MDAVVLDMDGLLIDTEPVWRTAEKEVFADLGIDLTEADLLDTTASVMIDVEYWNGLQMLQYSSSGLVSSGSTR